MLGISASVLKRGGLVQANAYPFCLHFAPMDPRKHITMSHNTHNMYLDLYEYGEYPDWAHICSVPARTYEAQVISTLTKALNQKLGTNITTEFLESKRNRTWAKFLAKDLKTTKVFHEVYPGILGKLSQDIFVKESRLTWVQEQKVRFDYTISSLDAETPVTVGDFIDAYNEDIEYCVLASNYGFAAEIDQAESALEKHERQQQSTSSTGIKELKQLDGAHDNFINRLMALIH